MNCQIKHKMKWLISDVCIVCESDIIHCKLEYPFNPNCLIGFWSFYKHPCHEQILRCLSHGFTLDFLFSLAWRHGRGHEAAFSWQQLQRKQPGGPDKERGGWRLRCHHVTRDSSRSVVQMCEIPVLRTAQSYIFGFAKARFGLLGSHYLWYTS